MDRRGLLEELRKGLAIDPTVIGKGDSINLAASGQGPTPEKSYMMARLYASFGDVERALDSLQQALNTGFTDRLTLMTNCVLVIPSCDLFM